MKILNKTLFSGWFMGVLLLVFAYAIGYATFIENDYGAAAARYKIYGAKWFEWLYILMIINFTGMIFTKRLYVKAKLNILVIHLALIMIIIGAAITRYYSFEGQMHIRNGQTSNQFKSADTYLRIAAIDQEGEVPFEDKVLLAEVDDVLLEETYSFSSGDIDAAIIQFLPNAKMVPQESEEGPSFISVLVGGNRGRYQFFLKEGEVKDLYDIGFSFNEDAPDRLIQFYKEGNDLYIKLPVNVHDSIDTNLPELVELGKVYSSGESSFMIANYLVHGQEGYETLPKESNSGERIIKLQLNGQEHYQKFAEKKEYEVGGNKYMVSVDYLDMYLPFAIKLLDFKLDRYPGSRSPSSFASDIEVIDNENNTQFPYSIYMNHILNYRGYRFFQSSYDNDEQGTVLTINHDYWGTMVTYIGYFLLFASLLLSFITKKTRFARVRGMLNDVHKQREKLKSTLSILLVAFTFFGASAQTDDGYAAQAEAFSKILVQNKEGRIEPVNTLANKVLVKISKKSSFGDYSANEVMLGMMVNPEKWQKETIVKVPEESVQELLGIDGDYAKFEDFLVDGFNYKIGKDVEAAHQKKPAQRSKHDKALINVDERINVLYMVLNGSMLNIFPIPDDANNKWLNPTEHHKREGHGSEYGDLFEHYTFAVAEAEETGDFSKATELLQAISDYQKEFGAEVMPSEMRLKVEVLYNEWNIFKKIFPIYFMIGVFMIALFFLRTFKPSLQMKAFSKVLLLLLFLVFLYQTLGLAMRWYISGHAPWSNGYESMIYISWATVLAGFIFMKKSDVTLGVTAMLAGITLLTAHMNWLNPELTNLVPVLKSHWLTIHVATITASYGFLGLGAMVAFLNMCIMIFRTPRNAVQVNLTLKELSLIIEMSISVGLVLLIIGNFLGGIWANESWGRYWGWDPKETWTLVTIILYTFTLHLVLIPSIRSVYTFSLMSFLSFGAVLMTYFGVNYYLSGLHSYASGDPIAIPDFVYYILITAGLVGLLAALNAYRFRNSNAA